MTRIITLITFFIVSVVTAQAQYEKGMQQALELWKNDKPTEAIAVFERIAAVDEANWLPNYYIAFINTVQSFRYMNDKVKVKALLEEAQKAQDKMNRVALDNPEVLVMQAMIHTGWIVYDPMVNGQKLSGDVMYIYNKAYQIAPENPRVVFQKASFEIGMASYFGQDTKPMCAQLEKSIELFANFKPETPFHPTWGLDRAQEELAKCKK
ncbi:hypothetical protein [Flavobacterium sp. NRK F7]|uniref:hypothetical protein n=1 Tax=Flavobacterium sp. NRK F7 TaxID=2954930 RepID=UPI0020917D1C|nr:hypothetical protein [Flavobacterium sp. NRK F7]MCO6163178.1 hypothetical protein [Flavobacterium sp. NRK F7]